MKLFWRDQTALLLLYGAQLIVTLAVFGLSESLKLWIAGYVVLLSTCLLVIYLVYRYTSMRTFYQRLSHPFDMLDESIDPIGDAPLSEGVSQLLQTQYAHYQERLHHYENKLRDHVTFINQWVHQMKTPLSVIHLTIQDEDDPLFTSIREETDRLRKGLETILYSSRLDAFEQDFHVEPIQLLSVARRVVSEHKSSFIRNRVYPEISIADDLYIYSDEKWLTFLLGQLVTNAIRYSSGTEQKVTLAASAHGVHVRLEVRDRGVGIPSQDLRRVFAPYFTGENGRKFQESTGMGLYLVQQICKHLQHQVELTSTVGVGTTVSLTLRQAPRTLQEM